jgi:hypothetical protein
MTPCSRFLADEVLGLFTRRTAAPNYAADSMPLRPTRPVDIGARRRNMERRRKTGRRARARGTYSVDFLDLRPAKFAAVAVRGV